MKAGPGARARRARRADPERSNEWGARPKNSDNFVFLPAGRLEIHKALMRQKGKINEDLLDLELTSTIGDWLSRRAWRGRVSIDRTRLRSALAKLDDAIGDLRESINAFSTRHDLDQLIDFREKLGADLAEELELEARGYFPSIPKEAPRARHRPADAWQLDLDVRILRTAKECGVELNRYSYGAAAVILRVCNGALGRTEDPTRRLEKALAIVQPRTRSAKK